MTVFTEQEKLNKKIIPAKVNPILISKKFFSGLLGFCLVMLGFRQFVTIDKLIEALLQKRQLVRLRRLVITDGGDDGAAEIQTQFAHGIVPALIGGFLRIASFASGVEMIAELRSGL